MPPNGAPAAEGSHGDSDSSPLDQVKYGYASSTRALTAGLAGTCVAILTFVLFFLYPRWTSGEIGTLQFQWTLLNIVVSLFLMSVSSALYWMVMEGLVARHPRTPGLTRWADRMFTASVLLLFLEPALILWTVAVDYVAEAALALWFVMILILVFAWRWFR